MVTETYGDMLFTLVAESLNQFRSPESLIRRVIISTKPPKENLKSQESKADLQDERNNCLDDWLKVDLDKVKRLSLSEQELEKAAKPHGPQIARN
ncbi:phosphoinositide phospholipase C 2-like protein [Tanacetum coccineum]